jgi:hypothetical protein
MADINSHKLAKQICCECCHYICSKPSDYNKHILTRKHINAYNRLTHADKNSHKIANYECKCGNVYKHRQSLHKHQQKCSITQEQYSTTLLTINDNNESNTPGVEIDKKMLIQMLLKNQEVMEKMMEIMPSMGNNSHNTNTITTNTTNNNQFNIQMFLNDRCKNAMNLTDFIDTLPITAETYDSTIDNGLTKTITNMITNGLSQLDILERPIHCTDASRKTLYVKEDNVWEKDDELIRILLGIRQIAAKQRTLINKWKDAHDDWNTNDRMQSRFTSLICNSITDIENEEKETNKIIRSISKTVYLDSDMKTKYLE